MNIEEIKKSFNGICVSADIWHPDDMKLVNELISKLEQAEKDFREIGRFTEERRWIDSSLVTVYNACEEALQAIRKGD